MRLAIIRVYTSLHPLPKPSVLVSGKLTGSHALDLLLLNMKGACQVNIFK